MLTKALALAKNALVALGLRVPVRVSLALTCRALGRFMPNPFLQAIETHISGLRGKDIFRLRERITPRREMDYTKSRITLEVTSPQEVMRLSSCAKEPWTVAWIENGIEQGDVVYDVGANVGAYSLIAARHTKLKARVYAFEPAFANYAALCRNIVANGCQDSITPLPIALGNTTGFVRFRYRMLAAGSALHATGDRLPGVKTDGSTPEIAYEQPMLGFRLDDLITLFGLPWPTHIKLDVDGAETEVLAGAAKALAHPRLKSMLVELGPQQDDASQTLIETLRFAGMDLAESFDPEKAGRPAYGLFVPRTTISLPIGGSQPATEPARRHAA